MSELADVALDGGAVEIRGALDLARTDVGLLPRRLPAWTRAQIPEAFCDMGGAPPGGRRLAVPTGGVLGEAAGRVQPTPFGGAPQPQPAGVFQLVVDGTLHQNVPAPAAGRVLA